MTLRHVLKVLEHKIFQCLLKGAGANPNLHLSEAQYPVTSEHQAWITLLPAGIPNFPNCDFIVYCFTENLLYLMSGIPWLFMFQWITQWSLKISVSPKPI